MKADESDQMVSLQPNLLKSPAAVGSVLESNGREVADLDDWSISTCYANAVHHSSN